MDYDCHFFFLNFIFYYYKVPIFILISAFNQIPAQLTFMLPYFLSGIFFFFFFSGVFLSLYFKLYHFLLTLSFPFNCFSDFIHSFIQKILYGDLLICYSGPPDNKPGKNQTSSCLQGIHFMRICLSRWLVSPEVKVRLSPQTTCAT